MAVDLSKIQPNIVTPNLADKIWLFYGEMGTRKTSVACKFPKHIMFSYDIGYKMINGAMAVPMQTWSDFKSAVKQLDNVANKERFSVVVIDTVGQAYQACYNYVLTQNGASEPGEIGSYGMGWKKIRNEFETTLRSIVQKGYGLVMLAHSDEVEREDKVTKKKVQAIKIDIDKRPDLIIKGLADFVFYLHKEPTDDNQEVPTVYAYSKLIDIDTKARGRYFTPRFEFNYENLLAEMEKAVKLQNAEDGVTVPDGYVADNPYAVKEVNFEQLRKEVIEIGSQLIEHGYENDVNTLLSAVFKGVRISEIKETDDTIVKLTTVHTTLLELKEKARI